LFGLVKDFDI